MHKYSDSNIEYCLNNIVDTFTGADGGIKFVNFQSLIRSMDVKAANGDEKAKDIISIMTTFSKLIDVSNSIGEK